MDKTNEKFISQEVQNEKFQPHKMWDLSRDVTDLIALIGATKSKDLPIPIEHFRLLYSQCMTLQAFSKDFLEYAESRNNE